MKLYKNINTGAVWSLEEITEAYSQFEHETDRSLEDTMKDFVEVKPWYAVQKDSTDPWDYGSHNYDEAIEMLKQQGEGLIAVINDDFCEEEIKYDDLF